MVSCFSFNRPDVEITDETPEGKQLDYSRPYTINRMYNVLKLEMNFNGWCKARFTSGEIYQS